MSPKPYRYNREYPVFYHFGDGTELHAAPGDERTFEAPPDDRWVPVEPKQPKTKTTGE